MKTPLFTFAFLFLVTLGSCQTQDSNKNTTDLNNNHKTKPMENAYTKTDAEWKKILTPEQYEVLREKGTERPGTGEYNNFSEKGIYVCGGCGTELFTSEQKFDSHCGWPSFDNNIAGGDRVKQIKYLSYGMVRTEIVCAKCGGHLGHIFDDGPTATGQRYCVNSLSLKFIPSKK
jgi:peptide-methionine (R)-S-oxide reductase